MKTFTPYEDPVPKIPSEIKSLIKFHLRMKTNLKILLPAFYTQGFKDGVRAHKQVVKKHADEIMEHFIH